MQNRFKNIQILLIIGICFSILVLPSYFRCTNASTTRFSSSDLFFENPDQENGLPDTSEKELKVFGPTSFVSVSLLGTRFSKQSSCFLSPGLTIHPETSVLRCWEDRADFFLNYPLRPRRHSNESLGLSTMSIFVFISFRPYFRNRRHTLSLQEKSSNQWMRS